MEAALVERRPDYGMQIEILVCLLYTFLVRSGDAVVDGGVAGALHTIPLSRLVAPSGIVYGFEASPPVAAWLKTRLAALPTAANIDFFPFALGDAHREVEFIIEQNAGYSHVRRAGEEPPMAESGRKTASVTMVTLDEALPVDAAINFMKLDLEGMDFAALRGGHNLILRHRPLIVFENTPHVTPDDYFGFFREIGYDVFDLENVPITPANLGMGNLSFEAICGPRADPRLYKARTLIDGFWGTLESRPVLQSWDAVRDACQDVFRYLLD